MEHTWFRISAHLNLAYPTIVGFGRFVTSYMFGHPPQYLREMSICRVSIIRFLLNPAVENILRFNPSRTPPNSIQIFSTRP